MTEPITPEGLSESATSVSMALVASSTANGTQVSPQPTASAVAGVVVAPPMPVVGSPSGMRRIFEFWHRVRPQRIALRRRVVLTFSLGSFALSGLLATITFSFARSTLLRQRDRAAITDTQSHADGVDRELNSRPSAQQLRDTMRGLGVEFGLLIRGEEAISTESDFGRSAVPQLLAARTQDGVSSRMIVAVNGKPYILVGVPLPLDNASYFEFTPLDDIQDTLTSVGRSSVAAAVVTTGLGVLLGSLAARRSVRPLAEAAFAAEAIAGGRLDTRLEITDDPDLRTLSTSFNHMATALQNRVERDARFASDVSHELRSPLMTLAASAEVLNARRDDLPEKSQAALDLLVADVSRFQNLVEDLLEISRFDAGAIRLHREELLLSEFVRQAVAVSSVPDSEIVVSERGESLVINADKRRLARAISNLIDNARFYGGGDIRLSVSEADDAGPVSSAWICVEDRGPGVPLDERQLVFERFARGSSAGRRATSEGAGLGLALVDEHVRMHGGRVWVDDRRDGEPGACFVIELPAEEIDE